MIKDNTGVNLFLVCHKLDETTDDAQRLAITQDLLTRLLALSDDYIKTELRNNSYQYIFPLHRRRKHMQIRIVVEFLKDGLLNSLQVSSEPKVKRKKRHEDEVHYFYHSEFE